MIGWFCENQAFSLLTHMQSGEAEQRELTLGLNHMDYRCSARSYRGPAPWLVQGTVEASANVCLGTDGLIPQPAPDSIPALLAYQVLLSSSLSECMALPSNFTSSLAEFLPCSSDEPGKG